ncbi:MAG: S-layer homology domain-containing protein [Oscillospiraceae bacterium]|jgi:hypothetical protein
MRRIKTVKISALILVLTIILQLPAAALAGSSTRFSDVPSGTWYEDYMQKLIWLEIIKGYPDGTFKPDNKVTRGEFLKMITIAAELYTTTKPKEKHWAAEYWQMAYENELLSIQTTDAKGNMVVTTLFPCTKAALDAYITRYEMAFLIYNTIYNIYCENMMVLMDAEKNITDYSTMDKNFRNVVAQTYAKGIITGYKNSVGVKDGAFAGDRNMTRAEACAAIVRLLWGPERKKVDFAKESEQSKPTGDFVSFAFKYRNMSVEERRLALFGNANKTHFTSASDAAGYIVPVEIRTWWLNSDGSKTTKYRTVEVHKLVAEEVKLIFEEIYNDPERFPIKDIGGARYSDALRHSWGCAIDINPNENYYLQYATGYRVGNLWEPGVNPYSITPNGSVVRAFAKYGWGWGGQGWSSGVDYMHFSILASGG